MFAGHSRSTVALLLGGCVLQESMGPSTDVPADTEVAPPDGAPPEDSDAPTTFVVDPPPELYEGCPLMPADTFFHADVRALPVHPSSETWRAYLGHDARLHLPATPDTSNPFAPVVYGVPHALADADTPRREVTYDGFYPVSRQYPGPFPLPAGLDIQTGFDQQTIILETDACELYELIGFTNLLGPAANGGAWFDLREHGPHPERWSVTAPRFPILATQVRASELRAGRIDHVLAVSIPMLSEGPPIWPALATDGRSDDRDAPPMGAWFRLRSDVDIDAMPPPIRTIARALQVHGGLIADTGGREDHLHLKLEKTTDWRDASGQDLRPILRTLGDHVTVADLEFLDPTPMRIDEDSWQIR